MKRRIWVSVIAVLLVVGLAVGMAVYANVQEKRNRALFEAVKSGDTRRVEALLDQGADPNVQTVPGTTPLMRAICFGQEHVVQLLLARGAKPFPLSLGEDPLLTYCSAQTASLLIQHGFPFDTPDSKGHTPLMSACDLEKNRASWLEIHAIARQGEPDEEDA